MKKTMTLLTALGILLGLSAALWAQTPETNVKTPRIHHRRVEQQKRIRQGVRSGELTKGETRKLEGEQKDVREDVKEARADGVVTKTERREITHDQNQASRDIARAKHNRRHRN